MVATASLSAVECAEKVRLYSEEQEIGEVQVLVIHAPTYIVMCMVNVTNK
jgi:hypothetical protein